MRGAPNQAPALRFEGLAIADPSGRTVLEDGWISVPEGSRCSLVCEESIARLALLRILLRLESPSAGTIRVHGEDLALVMPHRLRDLIALVPERPALVTGSLWENIILGRPDASTERIVRAIIASGLDPCVARLPQGARTHLPLRETSDTQEIARRVGLARVLLREPRVLVFHESEARGNETSIMLDQLPPPLHARTVFVVAHRPMPIGRVDIEYQVQFGRIQIACTPRGTLPVRA